jgi:hypothetical protein
MNERIQELAQQAFINAGYDTKDELFDILFKQGTEFHEKFAELIVDQCFKVALVEGKGYLDPIKLRDAMQKHFGVEE